MHNIRTLKFLILLPLVLSLGSPGAFAKPTAPAGAIATVGDLMPAARHASLDRTIAELLSQHH